MVAKERLKDLLSSEDISNTEKVLICLATDNATPKEGKEIKHLASSHGLNKIYKWNITAYLNTCGRDVIKIGNKWELTTSGKQRVLDLLGSNASTPPTVIASNIRKHLSLIKNMDVKNYVTEAIECFEARHYRACVILSWIGAISLLQEYVFRNCLMDFNNDAQIRFKDWKIAKTTDDIGRMKEHHFLIVLEAISVLGKNVKQELEKCLNLRNGCGHPNSLQIADSIAAAHLETLMLNVFSKFS